MRRLLEGTLDVPFRGRLLDLHLGAHFASSWSMN